MTLAQKEALEAELAEMEGPQRKAAVEAIATARAFGDLSENFEYHAAKNEQGLLEARIRKIRHRLQHAVVVEHTSTDVVGVGSVVEIEDEAGEVMEITISASAASRRPRRSATRCSASVSARASTCRPRRARGTRRSSPSARADRPALARHVKQA